MCALQFASKLEISSLDKTSDSTETISKLKELTNLVATHLK
jgi:cell division protein ZapA